MGGGDKPLLLLAGRPILGSVLDRIRPQVTALALSANGDPERFRDWNLPVLADPIEGRHGPLVGILAGMEWASSTCPETESILSVSADTPFLPRDLVQRLAEARGLSGAEIAVAASGGRVHPTVAIWPLALAGDLRQALVSDGVRKVESFARRYRLEIVEFGSTAGDPFFNINTPQDLLAAERLVAGAG